MDRIPLLLCILNIIMVTLFHMVRVCYYTKNGTTAVVISRVILQCDCTYSSTVLRDNTETPGEY